MRIVFMGTPEFAVPTLQALIDSAHDVVAVYSQPPRPSGRGHKITLSPVHQLAEQHGIAVHTPTTLRDETIQAQFRCHSADIAVVAAYGLLLPTPILEAYPHGCINVHPSDLPRWRGAAPIQHTILAGDTTSAMCIMQMDEGLDTGDILLRREVDVPVDSTAGQWHDRMAALGAEMVLETLKTWHDITPIPQSDEGVTYARKITKTDSPINWSKPAIEIYNQIRGLNPWPAATMTFRGETLKLFEAEITNSGSDDPFTVQCGDGRYLKILDVQRPGKKRMSAEACLRGWQ